MLKEYLGRDNCSPFGQWFEKLNAEAAAKVSTALYRLDHGNTSNTKSVAQGIREYRINFGPGYRIYYAYDSKTLILLLTGGTKKRQQKDIKQAKIYWSDYKQRKRKK